MLAKGGSLKLDNYKTAGGKTLSPTIQYDAFMKRLDFNFNAFRIPNKIGGVELTAGQKEDYAAGKRVDLGEPQSKNGRQQKPIIYQGEDGQMKRDNRNAQEQTAYDNPGNRQSASGDKTKNARNAQAGNESAGVEQAGTASGETRNSQEISKKRNGVRR
jgi:hypothetical protein